MTWENWVIALSLATLVIWVIIISKVIRIVIEERYPKKKKK